MNDEHIKEVVNNMPIAKAVGVMSDQIIDFTKYPEGASIQDYGAVGDGIADDSEAFLLALADSNTVLFPPGEYNLNHVVMEFDEHVTLIGENRNLVTVLNSGIIAKSGLTCRGITFSGGTKHQNYFWSHAEKYTGANATIIDKEMIFVVTPYHDCDLEYYDCVFEDSEVGSYAFQRKNAAAEYDNKFVNNICKNTVFMDLTCVGILHSVNIDKGEYSNNEFLNIGKEDTNATRMTCLSLGDVGDTTPSQIEDCVIEDNLFDGLITPFGDIDTGQENPKFGYNFIQVKGNRLKILHNVCKHLTGYGQDREGVYTKGHYVEVANNIIIESGLGEGYICCKNTPVSYPERIVNIHDNFLSGKYGAGIITYGGSRVTNNTIMIDRAKYAIRCYGEGLNSFGTVDVIGNQISCGIGDYIHNGEVFPEYMATQYDFIYTDNYKHGVTIKDNAIAIEQFDNYVVPSAIKSANTRCDVTIENNKITAVETNGIVINSSSGFAPVSSKSAFTFNINENVIAETKSDCITINISSIHLPMVMNIRNNTIKGIVNSGKYPVKIWASDDNHAIVYHESLQSANTYPANKTIYTNTKELYTNDPSSALAYGSSVAVYNLYDNFVVISSTMPNNPIGYVGSLLFYTGATTSNYYSGCIYKAIVTEVTPAEGDNPKTSGWCEASSNGYISTNDTTVNSEKTYYTASWTQVTPSLEQTLQ